MNETSLRWKARIGGLRGLSILIWIGVALLLLATGSRAYHALTGPAAPEAISIAALMAGGDQPYRYVSVDGEAYYEVGYTETSDGETVALYYILVDPKSGEAAVIRSPSTSLPAGGPFPVTLSGLVYSSSPELRQAVEADLDMYTRSGITVEPGFYLAEGEQPMGFGTALALFLGCAWLGVAAVIPFFFPTVVFAPQAMSAVAAVPGAPPSNQGVRVTGRLQQIKSLHPSLELGSRWQRFNNAVTNPAMLDDGRLMIYVHHVVRTQLYGVVTISRRESDWAVVISKSEPWQIAPGTIYGWRDRLAVRFRRQAPGGKPDDVFVVFAQPGEQAEFARSLRTAGFSLGMGVMV